MTPKKYRILLIEDDKVDQMAFTRFVRRQKLPYGCAMAESVAAARKSLADNEFDIILADYMLPDGTAFDVLESAKHIPFVFITGAGDEAVAVEAWKAGAADYLIKDPGHNYLKVLPIVVENAVTRKAITQKMQLLHSAVMSATDSICITDTDDRITFVNRAFCRTYGYTEQEILGRKYSILSGSEPLESEVRKVLHDVHSRQVGFRHRRKDGTTFKVSLTRSAIHDQHGNEIGLVTVARDMSEQTSLEDKVESLNLRSAPQQVR